MVLSRSTKDSKFMKTSPHKWLEKSWLYIIVDAFHRYNITVVAYKILLLKRAHLPNYNVWH